jgi:ketosteroid isomerase-like protein
VKKLLSLLGVVALVISFALPASAASKPIDVFIDGSKVTFAAAPYLQNNSVLVPFRAVFEKLKLKVLWDAKTGTVTGTGTDLVIKLKIGSNRASINGIVKQLTTAPLISGGTTYVPLRFVGEATGASVVWNPALRSVQITTAASKEQDRAQITNVINKFADYYNEENVAGIESLLDSSLEGFGSMMKSTFETYDFKSTLNNINIIKLEGDEAIVTTSETTLRVGGAYSPDEVDQYLYTLVRMDGSWLITDIELQEAEILLTREQGMKPAEAPQTETAAILSTLGNYYKALNAEDLKGVMATILSIDEETDEMASASLKQMFSQYSVMYTPQASNVYFYSGTEAAVYAEQVLKEAGDTDTYAQGMIYVFTKAADGSWKISDSYNVYETLSNS